MSERSPEWEGVGHYLRDLIYGANDGIITTFAVVSSVTGAGLESGIIIILGFANLAADGFSMAASNYLGMKSDIERTRGSIRREQPWRHGAATFLAFVTAGLFPLIPYFLPIMQGNNRFEASLATTVLGLAVVGGSRSRYTGRNIWRSAGEMVLIGGAAGSAAFVIGKLIAGYQP